MLKICPFGLLLLLLLPILLLPGLLKRSGPSSDSADKGDD